MQQQDKVKLDLSPEVPQVTSLYLLPCQISEPCTGPVQEYFTSKITKEGSHLAASFRGRALKGAAVELPKNMDGFICRLDETEEGGKEFVALSQFKGFTYWNHDVVPTGGDTIQKLIKFIKVLNAVNGEAKE